MQIERQDVLPNIMYARYYGPQNLFRFLSPDPSGIEERIRRPQSFNPYAYVRNNPLAFRDSRWLYATHIHEMITREALQQFGVSDTIISRIVRQVKRQDSGSSRLNHRAHATGYGRPDKIQANTRHYVDNQLRKATKAAANGNMNGVIKHVGKGLHAVQDLIGHAKNSNLKENLEDWIEEKTSGRASPHTKNDHSLDEFDRAVGETVGAFQKVWETLTDEQKEQLRTRLAAEERETGGLSVLDATGPDVSLPGGNQGTSQDGVSTADVFGNGMRSP